MSCADIARRVALYAGSDLDEASSRDVEGHLAACEGCRELLTVLLGQREAMGEWRAAALSQDDLDEVRNGVLAAIARGDARRSIFDRLWFAPSRPAAWGSAGLAAAALLVFAVWMTVSRSQGVQPAQSAAALPDRPVARAVAVPAPRAESQAAAELPTPVPMPVPAWPELRTDAQRATPAPSSRPLAVAERPAVMPAPPREAAGMRTAEVSPASGPPAVVAEARTAVAVPSAPAGPVRRIEIQTADPNIRIIWLMQETAPDPNRSGAAGR